jgi:SHS2 domain-containing protein
MAHDRERWDLGGRAAAYTELEHPADLFLEIRGEDPTELLEHALFAFYDQIAEIEGFEARRELTLSVHAAGLDEALRSLLSEALYLFDTEGFVAAGGEVTIESRPEENGAAAKPGGRSGAVDGGPSRLLKRDASPPGCDGRPPRGGAPGEAGAPGLSNEWRLSARLWGENAHTERHRLLHEVKAATYHLLSATRADGGWKATVLLDI